MSMVLSLGLELLQTSSLLFSTKILNSEDANYSRVSRSQIDQITRVFWCSKTCVLSYNFKLYATSVEGDKELEIHPA